MAFCAFIDELGKLNAEIAVYEGKADLLATRQADLQTSEKLVSALDLLSSQLTQARTTPPGAQPHT